MAGVKIKFYVLDNWKVSLCRYLQRVEIFLFSAEPENMTRFIYRE